MAYNKEKYRNIRTSLKIKGTPMAKKWQPQKVEGNQKEVLPAGNRGRYPSFLRYLLALVCSEGKLHSSFILISKELYCAIYEFFIPIKVPKYLSRGEENTLRLWRTGNYLITIVKGRGLKREWPQPTED
jgi:hypothetical protein